MIVAQGWGVPISTVVNVGGSTFGGSQTRKLMLATVLNDQIRLSASFSRTARSKLGVVRSSARVESIGSVQTTSSKSTPRRSSCGAEPIGGIGSPLGYGFSSSG